ncbi:MAG: ABC transporter ATP-binding protein, partial [Pseudolabrys sp.]|nr:ABC transporter ATP-binding protein [Pseudolabrys sp.]
RAFLQAEWSFLFERKSGELVSAVTNETGRLVAAAQNLFSLAAACIVGALYLGYGFALSPQVTGTILLLAVILVLLLGRLYRNSFGLGAEVGPLLAEQQVLITEFVQGAKAVKAAVIEERVLSRINKVVAQLQRANRMSNFLPFIVRAVFESGGLITLIFLLVFAVVWMHSPLANLLVVLALFVRLFPRISSLQQYIHSLNAFVPSIAVLHDLAETAERRRENIAGDNAAALAIPLPSSLSLQDVTCYLGGNRVLDDINSEINIPGVTAVVGSSGAGKSTLLSALLRLVPVEGQILLDGQNIGSLPLARWRRAIGFVPQEPILFHASILQNVTIARPDADQREIALAAKRAQLDDFVRELPEGYDTVVGDQGIRLSGGQRQRVGLARALLGSPRFLILDEATSSLDSITEAAFLDTMNDLRDQMGILIVAHRLASVRGADQIIVMDHGRIVDSGNWEFLIRRSDRFKTLIANQQF